MLLNEPAEFVSVISPFDATVPAIVVSVAAVTPNAPAVFNAPLTATVPAEFSVPFESDATAPLMAILLPLFVVVTDRVPFACTLFNVTALAALNAMLLPCNEPTTDRLFRAVAVTSWAMPLVPPSVAS